MLKIRFTNKFKKDNKLLKKRHYDLSLMDNVIEMLANEQTLPAKYHDHALTGLYTGFRECHILPDWLLIYEIDGNELFLYLTRTGTHNDLFC